MVLPSPLHYCIDGRNGNDEVVKEAITKNNVMASYCETYCLRYIFL